MRKEYVPDCFLLMRSAVQPQTTRVDGYGFVDEIAADVLAPGGVLRRRPQHLHSHATASSTRTRECSSQVSISPFPFTWIAPRLSSLNLPFKRSYTLRVS